MKQNGLYQFSRWLPDKLQRPAGGWDVLDCDLAGWIAHFTRNGRRCEIRMNDEQKIALFVEGRDAFPEESDKA